MKKSILILITVFTAQLIYSQSGFRKGYIISLQKDTIYGLVSYGESSKNNHFCFFKANKESEKKTYLPSEIYGYGFIDDRYFETKKIEVDDKIAEPVLLEVLVKGLVKLYRYESIFYVDKADTGLIKLSHESIETTENGISMSRLSTKYIGILSLYLSDCQGLRSSLQDVAFNEREFTNLVEKYNECKDVKSKTYKEKKSWLHLKAGILSGAINSSIKFETIEGSLKYLVPPFTSSVSPVAGVSLNLASPRINENISFQADFIYSKSAYYSYNEKYDLFHNETVDYVSISLTQLKIPLGLRFSLPSGKFKPFISAGLSTTFNLSSQSDWISEYKTRSIEPFATVPRYTIKLYNAEALEIQKNQMGMWGEAGLAKAIGKKLDGYVAFRFEKGEGLSTSAVRSVLSSSSSCFQFIIGINTK